MGTRTYISFIICLQKESRKVKQKRKHIRLAIAKNALAYALSILLNLNQLKASILMLKVLILTFI
jgi:hypothetical protein